MIWLYEWVLAPAGLFALVQPLLRAAWAKASYNEMAAAAYEMNPQRPPEDLPYRYFIRHVLEEIPPVRGPGYSWHGAHYWMVYEIGEDET